MVLLRLFSGRCARATLKKSPTPWKWLLTTDKPYAPPRGRVAQGTAYSEASEEPLSERRELRGAL